MQLEINFESAAMIAIEIENAPICKINFKRFLEKQRQDFPND